MRLVVPLENKIINNVNLTLFSKDVHTFVMFHAKMSFKLNVVISNLHLYVMCIVVFMRMVVSMFYFYLKNNCMVDLDVLVEIEKVVPHYIKWNVELL